MSAAIAIGAGVAAARADVALEVALLDVRLAVTDSEVRTLALQQGGGGGCRQKSATAEGDGDESQVQRVELAKANFDEAAAKTWAEEYGLGDIELQETKTAYVFEVFPAGECMGEESAAQGEQEGVKIYMCVPATEANTELAADNAEQLAEHIGKSYAAVATFPGGRWKVLSTGHASGSKARAAGLSQLKRLGQSLPFGAQLQVIRQACRVGKAIVGDVRTKAMELIARRARPGNLSQAPPVESRHFCYPVTKDVAGYVAPGTEVLAIDTNKMCASFVITTFAQDRMGDVVVPQGCVETLDTYRRNPIVFFGHQVMPLPIGLCRDPQGNFTVKVENDKAVTATIWFYQGKHAPNGDAAKNAADVFALVAEGVLSATSIGFRVIDGTPIAPRGQAQQPDEHTGIYITKWELLEVSIVGVPANPYCGVVGAQNGNASERASWAADRIASYLSRGRITEKNISPHLRKALAPLAAQR